MPRTSHQSNQGSAADAHDADERPRKQIKILVACDACRARKSRCDGSKPTCGYCKSGGLNCTYRPRNDVEFDQDLLLRLNRVEARLAQMERVRVNGEDSNSVPQAESSTMATSMSVYSGESIVTNDSVITRIPRLHTAGAFKMLQYWPQVRLNLGMGSTEPLVFLGSLENSQSLSFPSWSISNDQHSVPFERLGRVVEDWYDGWANHDQLLVSMLREQSVWSKDSIFSELRFLAESNSEKNAYSSSISMVSLETCTISQLLILSLAFFRAHNSESLQDSEHGALSSSLLSDCAFRLALSRFWEVSILPDHIGIPCLLLAASMWLERYLRPTNALKLIELGGFRLSRPSKQPISESQDYINLPILKFVHFAMESDMLLELDGTRSVFSLDGFIQYLEPRPESSASPATAMRQMRASGDIPDLSIFSALLGLRVLANRILSALYTADKAYCHPNEITQLTLGFEKELHDWYNRLPISCRFAREISSFEATHGQSAEASTQYRQLRQRFYYVSFLLRRPILYFMAYEEPGAPPMSSPDAAIFLQEPPLSQNVWVLESCQQCLQYAVLAILSCGKSGFRSSGNYGPPESWTWAPSWTEIQIVLAAALAISFAISTKSSKAIIPGNGDLSTVYRALDTAEDILHIGASVSSSVAETLRMVRNVRHTLGNVNRD